MQKMNLILLKLIIAILIVLQASSKEIFLKFDETNKFCLSRKTCDGSRESPSSSFLDTLEMIFNPILEGDIWSIVFYDELYTLTGNEAEDFLLYRNKSRLAFNDESLISLRSIRISGQKEGGKKRTSFLMKNNFFTFELRSSGIIFEQLDILVGKNENKIFRNDDFFFKTIGSKSKVELKFINVTLTINVSESATTPTTGSLIFCTDLTFLELQFSNFSFNTSGGAYLYFIRMEKTINENLAVSITIANSLFSAGENQTIMCMSKIYKSSVAIVESIFLSPAYLPFEYENSVVIIERTQYILSSLEYNLVTQKPMMSFLDSSISLSNTSIFGRWSLNSRMIKPSDVIYFEAVSGSKVKCKDLLIQNLSMKAVFLLSSNNSFEGTDLVFRFIGNTAIFANTSNNVSLLNLYFKNSLIIYSTSLDTLNGLILTALKGNDIKIDQADISENELYLAGLFVLRESNLRIIIDGSHFTSNLINLNGSLLHIAGLDGFMIISSCYFENSSSTEVGAIAKILSSTYIQITKCFFRYSFARSAGCILIDKSFRVSLVDSTFKESNSMEGGGSLVIKNSIEVTFYNITFENIYSIMWSGGAALIESSLNITIKNCLFSNTTSLADGGAIKVINGSFLLTSNTGFEFSNAKLDGGALALENINIILIERCQFINTSSLLADGGSLMIKIVQMFVFQDVFAKNTFAGGKGGVLSVTDFEIAYIKNQSYEFSISDKDGGSLNLLRGENIFIKIIFSRNSSSLMGQGGFLHVMKFKNCLSEEVRVENSSAYKGGSFGFITGNTLLIQKGYFGNSNSEFQGGSVSITNVITLIIQQNYIEESNSAGKAGSIFAQDVAILNINDTQILTSNSLTHGGSHYFENIDFLIMQSQYFLNCLSYGSGGSFYLNMANVIKIRGISSEASHAFGNGGAFYMSNAGSTFMESLNFMGSISDSKGGDIFIKLGETILIENFVSKSSWSTSWGGSFIIQNIKNIFLQSQQIADTTSKGNGGSIAVTSGDTLTMRNISTTNTISSLFGGIFFIRDIAYVIVENSQLANSQADNSGGSIYVGWGTSLTVRNVSTSNSTALALGGVLDIESIDYVIVENDQFIDSLANNRGGVIFVEWGKSLVVRNLSCTNSFSSADGGVLDIEAMDNVIVENNLFIKSRASRIGGCIFVGWGIFFTVRNLTGISSDSISGGGALNIQMIDNVMIDNNQFMTSFAQNLGGSIFVAWGITLTVTSLYSTSSSAIIDGGVMNIQSFDNVVIENNQFIESFASGGGGSIFVGWCISLTINNITSEYAHSEKFGGILNIQVIDNVIIENIQFINSDANAGGTIFAGWGQSLIIRNCFVKNSTATESFGGVFYIAFEKNIIIENQKYEDSNSVSGAGGSIQIIHAESLIMKNVSTSSTFGQNYGGFLSFNDVKNVSIEDQIHWNSSSNGMGGCFSLVNGDFVFLKNIVVLEAVSKGGKGGVLFIGGINKIFVQDQTIFNSLSNAAGGAIFIGQDIAMNLVILSNISLTNTHSLSYAGAFYIEQMINVIIDNITLNDSWSFGPGGSICVILATSFTIRNVFIRNSASLSTGGSLYIRQIDFCLLEELRVFSSNALSNGGFMSVNGSSRVIINKVLMENCFSQMSGGSIYIEKIKEKVLIGDVYDMAPHSEKEGGSMSFIDINSLEVVNIRIELSFSYINGGSIFIEHVWKNAEIKNCSILHTKSIYGFGGAISISLVKNISIIYSQTMNTSSYSSGGAISISASSFIDLKGCLFQDAATNSSGGVIHFLESSKISISESLFIRTFAASDGGVLNFQFVSEVNISKCDILDSYSKKDGGFISMIASKVINIFLVALQNSISEVSGGAISIVNSDGIKIHKISSKLSKTMIFGGFLVVIGSKFIDFTSSSVIDSAAEFGAYAYMIDSHSLLLWNLRLESGLSSIGGVMFSGSLNFTMDACLLLKNIAKRGGADITLESGSNAGIISKIVILQSINGFEGSVLLNDINQNIGFRMVLFSKTSSERGGSICILDRNLNIFFKEILIISVDSLDGGTVYFGSSNNNISIDSLILFSSWGQRGGLCYVHQNNTIFIKRAKVLQALASTLGGLVFSGTDNNITFENTVVDYLGSDFDGGVIYLNSSTSLNFTSLVIRNAYSLTGGAFFVRNMSNLRLESASIGKVNCTKIDSEIFKMAGDKPSIRLLKTSVFNLSDYLVIQMATTSDFTITNCSVYLSDNYTKSGFLIISSPISQFNAQENLIFLNNKTLDYFVMITSAQVTLSFKSLITNFEKVRTFLITSRMDVNTIFLSKFDLSRFNGTLIFTQEYEIRDKNIKLSKISIENSLFRVNKNAQAFINIKGFTNLSLYGVTFLVSKNSYQSLIFAENPSKYNVSLNLSILFKLNRTYCFIIKSESIENESQIIPSFNPVFGSQKSFSHVELNQFFVFLHKINMNSILLLDEGKSLLIKKSSFIGNYLNEYSHFLQLKIYADFKIKILGSNILRNRVVYGGIMSIQLVYKQPVENYTNLAIIIQNSTLQDNSANKGGLFYFNTSIAILRNKDINYYETVFRKLNLKNNVIKKTRSYIGSFLFWEGNVSKSLDDKNLTSPSSKHLDYQNYLTYSSIDKVSVSPLNTFDYNSSKNIQIQGKTYQNREEIKNYFFCIGFYDNNQKLLYAWSESQIKAHLKKNETLIKWMTFMEEQIRIRFIFNKGLFCAYKFEILYDYFYIMGQKFNITLDVYKTLKDADPTFSYLSENINTPLNISFEVDECKEGEFFEDSSQSCAACQRNSFSNRRALISQPDCQICKETDNFNCYGANLKSPKQNFWRLDFKSENFLRCPSSSCIGDIFFEQNFTYRDCYNCFLPGSSRKELYLSYYNNTNSIGFCAHGNLGVLCTGCKEGLGFEIGFKCGDCSSKIYYLKQFIILLIKLVFFIFINFKSIKNKFNTIDIKSPDFITNFRKIYLMKIILAHFSYLSFLNNLKFNFGENLDEFSGIAVDLSPSEDFKGFSFECLLKDIGLTFVSYIYLRALISIIFLALMFTIMIVLSTVFMTNKRFNFFERLKSIIRGVTLIFVTNNIILIINILISSLICVNIGDDLNPDFRIVQQPNVLCYDSYYNYFSYILILPLIVITTVLVPFYIFVKILKWRGSKVSMKHEFQRDFGYFYCAFRRDHNYFELFLIISKVSLVILKQYFLSLIITKKEITGVLIFILYTLIVYSVVSFTKPYKKKKYGMIERCEIFSLSTNISNGLIAFFWISTQEDKRDITMQMIILFYFSLSNGIFIFRWISIYLSFKDIINLSKLKSNLTELIKNKKRMLSFKMKPKKQFQIYFRKHEKEGDYVSIRKTDLENMKLLNKLLIQRLKFIEKKLLKKENQDELKCRDTPSPPLIIANNPMKKPNENILSRKILEEISIKSECSMILEPNIEFKQIEPKPKKNLPINNKSNLKLKINTVTSDSGPEITLNSKELLANSFYNHMLVMKYSISPNPFIEEGSELSKLNSLDPDWSVSSNYEEKKGTWTIALKKHSNWIEEPFMKTLELETKNPIRPFGRKGSLKIIVNLSDFISIRGISILELPTDEEPIFHDISDFQFKLSFTNLLKALKIPHKSEILILKVDFSLVLTSKKPKEIILKLTESGKLFHSSEMQKKYIISLLIHLDQILTLSNESVINLAKKY